MRALDIFVWQEAGVSSIALPEAFQQIPVTPASLPAGVPILVATDQLASLAAVVAAAEDADQQPYPILYLRDGEEEPPEAASYVCAVVRQGEWDALESYVRHPDQFRVQEWATELSNADLDRLPNELKYAQILTLPLPGRIRQILADDQACLDAFEQAIAQERATRWAVTEPTAEDIAAYTHSKLSLANASYIEAYLERSPVGRATFNTLLQELQPVLEVPLPQSDLRVNPPVVLSPEDVQRLSEQLYRASIQAAAAQTLLRLLVAFYLARLWRQKRGPVGEHHRGETQDTSSPTSEPETFENLITWLLEAEEGETVLLVKDGYEISFSLDAAQNQVHLKHIRRAGSEAKAFFLTQLRKDDDVFWEQKSKAGQVALPLDVLQKALDQGDSKICFLAG